MKDFSCPHFLWHAKKLGEDGVRRLNERPMMPSVRAMPLFLLFLALAAGCDKAPAQPVTAAQYQANAEAAYAKALESFHQRDWVSVPLLMEEVKQQYPGTKWARLAQLRIADAHFHEGSYPEAITAYREFLHDFPSDDQVRYARYRVILCQFESRGDSITSPPLEERDLSNVRDASRSIDAFLRDYPDHPRRERLIYMRKWVRGMLARHELYVARYYLSEDNFKAALSRTEYALAKYQDTGLEPEALVLLGETHMKRGKLGEATEAFELVLDRFPSSPFVHPARRFLAELADRRSPSSR